MIEIMIEMSEIITEMIGPTEITKKNIIMAEVTEMCLRNEIMIEITKLMTGANKKLIEMTENLT